jgi:hypothetical protein
MGFPNGDIEAAIKRLVIFFEHYRIERRFRLENTS